MTDDDHVHDWRPQPAVFMKNGLDNCIAIVEYCESCKAVRGHTPDSNHEDVEKIALDLEQLGPRYYTKGEQAWITARRALCPIQ